MKKYSVEEIKKWLSSYDEVFSAPSHMIEDLDTYGGGVIDRANLPSQKIKDAHNEMNKEDKNEELDSFEEDGGRLIVY